jgi:hypothetical protein
MIPLLTLPTGSTGPSKESSTFHSHAQSSCPLASYTHCLYARFQRPKTMEGSFTQLSLHHATPKADRFIKGSTESWLDEKNTRYRFPTATINSMPARFQRPGVGFSIWARTPGTLEYSCTVIPHHRELHRSSELAIFSV